MRNYVQESGTYRDGSLEHEAQRNISFRLTLVRATGHMGCRDVSDSGGPGHPG